MDALSGGERRARPVAGEDRVELTLPARPEHVATLRAAARSFAEKHGVLNVGDVTLAISEAVTNAVVHAYRSEAGGPVRLTATRTDAGVMFTIEDEGCGLRTDTERPGAGLGLGLMARLAESFTMNAGSGGGTSVQLTFAAGAG
jgi:anti-sigma regulatory factor (Ser/Thr protein kinase)